MANPSPHTASAGYCADTPSHCLNTAKATAYSAVFAVFPMLGFFAGLVTLLPGSAPLRYQLAIFMNRVLPAAVAPLFQHYFITAHTSPQGVKVLLGAALVSVYGAGGVMGMLMDGFRRAYGLTPAAYRDLCTNVPD